MATLSTIIIILLILMLALAFGIGANDETMATLVGSRAVKLKVAVILGGVLVFVGVLFLSASVGKTVGKSLLGEDVDYTVSMMLAILISTTIWLVIASKTGAPISTTHSVVGSVFGIAIVWAIRYQQSFISALSWDKMGGVVLGWVLSPLFGYFGAYLFELGTKKFMASRKLGLDTLEGIERKFVYFLIAAVCWTQISRGGNDSANALGIMYGLIESGGIDEGNTVLVYTLVVLTGLMLTLGLVVVGRNVIKNVGNNLIEMRPSDAFSIQISTSIVIFVATMLGLPVSGSHILIFAVLGAGRVKGERPDKKTFRKMVISWVITFPVAATLSALCYLIFIPIFS
ncbi:MAG: inorganic phosphate transporter [Promethearchaeota archaeon]